MRRSTRQRRLRSRLPAAAAVAVIAIAVAVIAIVAMHRKSHPPAQATTALRLDPGETAVRARASAGGGQTASSITNGDYSTCALVRGQSADCWGDNAYGQLGNGANASALAPVHVGFGQRIETLSAGGSHVCALAISKSVACWGANAHGELGNGSLSNSSSPTFVSGVEDAVAVAAGVAHSCAVLQGGGVKCWGANSNGQLGNGTTVDSERPVTVRGVSGATSITAGLAHTCALVRSGNVFCWGANANGELGNGTLVDSTLPVEVTGLTGRAVAVDAGDAHTCALLAGGAVECWGWNIEGQLGNGGGSDSATPVQVTGLTKPVTALAAGGSHTCALLQTGAVDCWGANLYGQLGNGTTSDTATPTPVAGLDNGVVAISAGLYHSCALLNGGSATCWGWNAQGQLGNGTLTSSSSPVGVAQLGLAADGTGTIAAAPTSFRSRTRNATVTLTYTAAPGGIHDGAVAVTVPPGWTPPSTVRTAPGYATASAGRVQTIGRTISVSQLTLGSGATLRITYARARTAPAGAATWRTREQSSSTGSLSLLQRSPVVHVLSADGSGTMVTKTAVVPSGARVHSIVFTYTAAAGGLQNGAVAVKIPEGWSGSMTASRGSVSFANRTVTVNGVTLAGNGTLRLTYNGARAPTTNVGMQAWETFMRSSPGGRLRALTASPEVNVLSANGSGRVYGYESTVANGATGVHLTFTFQAETGGIENGLVTFSVPPGWSAPSTSPRDPGYVTATLPKLQVNGRTVSVPVAKLGVGNGSTFQLTYGAGKGADAPRANVGAQEWLVRERSLRTGTLTSIESPPKVTVLSSDGSGTLFRATGSVAPGSSRNTVVFVYRSAAGGLDDGTITLTVPAGWSRPSRDGGDPGFVTATAGTVSISGRTVTISHVFLSSGATLSVIYGNRQYGGPGATAPRGGLGPNLWPASERSTAEGTLRRLR